ncbi:MAG: hypothetical protein K1X35_13005 [Caulobacteraceae bacterium]|nr:hypothetical protein [Caulobacteraceae bacterium]
MSPLGKILVRILATVTGLAGAVLAGFAGLCSYAFASGTSWTKGGGAMVLVFGGVPIVLGLAMIVACIFLWRITLKGEP